MPRGMISLDRIRAIHLWGSSPGSQPRPSGRVPVDGRRELSHGQQQAPKLRLADGVVADDDRGLGPDDLQAPDRAGWSGRAIATTSSNGSVARIRGPSASRIQIAIVSAPTAMTSVAVTTHSPALGADRPRRPRDDEQPLGPHVADDVPEVGQRPRRGPRPGRGPVRQPLEAPRGELLEDLLVGRLLPGLGGIVLLVGSCLDDPRSGWDRRLEDAAARSPAGRHVASSPLSRLGSMLTLDPAAVRCRGRWNRSAEPFGVDRGRPDERRRRGRSGLGVRPCDRGCP